MATTNPILIPRNPTGPLDPTLRTSLQSTILNPKTIKALRRTLESETQADAWQEKVKRRTLQLLQSKEYWKWEELVGVIVREARGVEDDDDDNDAENESENDEGGDGERKGNEARMERGGEEKVDIRIPEKAVAEAAMVVKGVLEKKVELEPEGKGFWD